MKKKSKRYYGMTMSQIQILVGAAVGGFLIICIILAFLLLPTSTPAAPPAAQTKVALTATKTPAPIIASNTDTPTPPVIATKIPPVGWLEFTTQGAAIWLPNSFIGGDMGANRENTVAKVARLGRYYKSVTTGMKNAGKETVMWMMDKTPRLNEGITNVIVSQIASPEDVNLDDYIKNNLNSDSNGTPTTMLMTVNQTKKITVLGRDARRLTISQMFFGREAVGIIYYVKDGSNIWSIMFIFSSKQYVDMFANAEKSIQTFYITE